MFHSFERLFRAVSWNVSVAAGEKIRAHHSLWGYYAMDYPDRPGVGGAGLRASAPEGGNRIRSGGGISSSVTVALHDGFQKATSVQCPILLLPPSCSCKECSYPYQHCVHCTV